MMPHDLQNDLFKVAFGPKQLVGGPNRFKWTESSEKLKIYPMALCPLYSLPKVAGAYSIR